MHPTPPRPTDGEATPRNGTEGEHGCRERPALGTVEVTEPAMTSRSHPVAELRRKATVDAAGVDTSNGDDIDHKYLDRINPCQGSGQRTDDPSDPGSLIETRHLDDEFHDNDSLDVLPPGRPAPVRAPSR